MYQETNVGEPVRGTTRDLVGGDYLHRFRQKQNAQRRKMLDVPLEAEAKTSHFMLVCKRGAVDVVWSHATETSTKDKFNADPDGSV